MMNCCKNRNVFGVVTGVMSAVLLILGGCSDVDNTLGLGFVPGDQNMKVKDTVFLDMVDTYMSVADSIPYSNQGLVYLGSTIDPIFGKSVGSSMLQYYPTDFDKKSETGYFGFGHNPVADSAKIVLFVSTYTNGDPSVEQTFNIYPMTTRMKADSTYYNSVDMTGLYDHAKPLFSFKLKDITQSTTLSLKLDPTAEGLAYLQSLVDVPEATYADSAAYREQFKGLYVAPAPGSPVSANIFTILLYNDQTGYISSALELYAHNYEQGTTTIQDTVRHTYHFSDKKLGFNQLTLSRLERDYTGTVLETLPYAKFDSVPPAGSAVQSTLYLQSAAGVFPYLYITDELLDNIQALKPNSGYDLLLNEAVIKIPLLDPTNEKMDVALGRIGMYHSYGSGFANVIDYDYYTEKNSSITLPYGGYIDRHFEYYKMNIASYLTRLLRERESDQVKPKHPTQRTIALGSDFYTMMLFQRQVELIGKGSATGKKIEVKLIYTLIPKQK